MISRVVLRWRWLRRNLTRTHWASRLLGYETPSGEALEPGLILIQIDGLSRKQLERAMHTGSLPFLSKLLQRRHFTLETFYSGVPSTTPAVQAEIFFGVKAAVPAFQFLRRNAGVDFRMYEATSAAEIESELLSKCPEPLLQGAHAYSNIYRAGAKQSRYCSQDFAAQALWKRMNLFKWLVLSLAYLPKILRIVALGIIEFGLAILDAIRGLYEREELFAEFAFVPARVAVCIVLREAIRFRILLDIERGVQVIHANFLGYDEQAHRRGPDSTFAHWTLKGIDRAIRDIYQAGNYSGYRDYELMVYSDHGQERAVPYSKRHGRELDVALMEVFSNGPLSDKPVWTRKMSKLLGSSLDRCRAVFGYHEKSRILDGAPNPEEQIVVTAMGPVGHIYLPEKPGPDEMEQYSIEMVRRAGIPLVMLRPEDGQVRAFNNRGAWILPQDRAEVLGRDHPLLNEAAEDLVRLCGLPDAGDFIINGWDPEQQPLTFPMENGAHGGPGTEETAGFLLVPDRIKRWHIAHLAGTRKRVRGEDLREIVMHYLGRDGRREERVSALANGNGALSLRVMTYNIHSCVGIDGKVRPERVARVINHFDPDLVAVQEVDCHRSRSGGHDQAQMIADHLRMNHVFEAMFEEKKERYGIAIFSKHPMSVVKSGYLTTNGGSRFREARGAIWVKLEIDGRDSFHFVNTHFGLGRDEKSQQMRELLGENWLGAIPECDPVILCGDFNSGPQSKVFRQLPRYLHDAQQALGGSKPRATFSSINPFMRIDHVFVSDHFTVKSIEVPHTPTAVVASDHLPVCVELSIPISK